MRSKIFKKAEEVYDYLVLNGKIIKSQSDLGHKRAAAIIEQYKIHDADQYNEAEFNKLIELIEEYISEELKFNKGVSKE